MKDLLELKKRVEGVSVLVVGDVMLDQYFWGSVSRISPEAPVPVFELKDVSYSLGGAANVAANVKGLGAEAILCGLLGDDKEADVFLKLAESSGIDTSFLVKDGSRPTTVKTRIIAKSQHLLRIDIEEKKPPEGDTKERLKANIERALERCNCVIISDYAKGVFLAEGLCLWLIEEARRRGKFVFVDPKGLEWKKYQGATCITPNKKEFDEVILVERLENKEMGEACEKLVRRFGLSFMVVTLGPEGMFLYHPEEGTWHFPARAREVYDVSGAGDTAIASLATFFSAGVPVKDSVFFANACAGVVVGKMGTKPIYWEEFASSLKEFDGGKS